jgi:hypothetical protein
MWFDTRQFSVKLWGWKWPAIALVESFVIVILTAPSMHALLLLAVVLCGVLAEMSDMSWPVTLRALGWAGYGVQWPVSSWVWTNPAGKASAGAEKERSTHRER